MAKSSQPRRPKFRRTIKPGQIRNWPAGVGAPDQVAARVTYTGSPLHKTYPSPSGPAAWRADEAKCDQFSPDQWPRLLAVLREAIRAGVVSDFRGEFPQRVWAWINGVLHEARLTNAGLGDYHGFPINDKRGYPLPMERVEEAPRVAIPVV